MTDRFEISMMRKLKFFLEFQIKQLVDGTFLNQTKYIHDILKKFGMDKAKSIKTLIGINGHLDLYMGGKLVDQKVYHSIIDSLLYLCTSRLDIMLNMCMCARFQTAPKECHMRVVNIIMRYLVLTPKLRLWYPKGSHFDLIDYSDADYDGCKVDRKSTFETCQFLGRFLVSWFSKKQSSVALSTIKAKYVAADSCCAQLLWMRQTLKDYVYTMNQVPLLCDNKGGIKIAYNPYEHFRTKHINIRHHFLRDHAIKGDIIISHVQINEQLIDIFTKPLDKKRFLELRSELNVIDSRNVA
jgi:hypothetical protein